MIMCLYLRSFIWLLIFIFLAYPLAFIACLFYVFVQPFAVCCQFMYNLEDYLFELVSLPMILMHNIIYSKSFNFNKSALSRQNSISNSLRQAQNLQLNTRNSFGNIGTFGINNITGQSSASCLNNNLCTSSKQVDKKSTNQEDKLNQNEKKSPSSNLQDKLNLPNNQLNNQDKLNLTNNQPNNQDKFNQPNNQLNNQLNNV